MGTVRESGNNFRISNAANLFRCNSSCNAHFTDNKSKIFFLVFWRKIFWNFVNAVRDWKILKLLNYCLQLSVNQTLLYYNIIIFNIISSSRFRFLASFLEPFFDSL